MAAEPTQQPKQPKPEGHFAPFGAATTDGPSQQLRLLRPLPAPVLVQPHAPAGGPCDATSWRGGTAGISRCCPPVPCGEAEKQVFPRFSRTSIAELHISLHSTGQWGDKYARCI